MKSVPFLVVIANIAAQRGLAVNFFREGAPAERNEASSGVLRGTQAACSDLELATYVLAQSYGPKDGAPFPSVPKCRPSRQQRLHSSGTTAIGQQKHVALATHKSKTRPSRREPAHFVHLRVVTVTDSWCPAPCDSPSWELGSPKAEVDGPYSLYEVAIWQSSGKITLYQFDPEFLEKARNSYYDPDLCAGKGWGCTKYMEERESRAVLSVGPPQMHVFSFDKLSVFLRDTFKTFFKRISELEPQARNFGLTYSGHGHRADGSLFEGQIFPHHVAALLKYVTGPKDGDGDGDGLNLGKMAMLNFGTNCAEGRWNMLEAFAPYADWILASDLNVGGIDTTSVNPESEALQAGPVIKRCMEERMSVDRAVQELVVSTQKFWEGMRKEITDQQVRQTLSAFAANKVAPFKSSLKSVMRARQDKFLDLDKVAQGSDCDLLTIARFLDESAGPPAEKLLVVPANATKHHLGPIEAQYYELRPHFASTQEFFQWRVQVNGLGLNHGPNSPKCDWSAFN